MSGIACGSAGYCEVALGGIGQLGVVVTWGQCWLPFVMAGLPRFPQPCIRQRTLC